MRKKLIIWSLDKKKIYKLLIILIFFGTAILFLIGFNFIVKGGYTPNEIEKWCSTYEKGSDFYLQCKKYMTPYTEEYINKGYAYMKLSLFLLLALLGVIGGIKLYKNKNMDDKIPEQDLKKSCKDILYEIVMLKFSHDKYLTADPKSADYKLLIDSFIIHFRDLYYFFYKEKKPFKNENLAKYYLPNYQDFINKRTDEKSFVINGISYIIKANIQLAHLSLERRSDNYQLGKAGDWPVGDMKSKLDITIRAFFECLPELKKLWFRKAGKAGLDDLPIPPNIEKLYS